uniref:TBC1 domain family member 4 n=1 Tax=Cyclopterus lumpus TaxID=8103 RepID=A0A8C3AZF4_CYCLU
MEGLYFEVKPRRDEPSGPGSAEKPAPKITLNRRLCPSLPHLASSAPCPPKPSPSARKRRMASWGEKVEEEEEEVRYKLTLIGSLPVHQLTTMAMLPWVVAEISKSAERSPGAASRSGGHPGPSARDQTVLLCVSASRVRCVSVLGEGEVWDPLTRTVLLECSPHQVTKLIHNSQEPSGFGCLVRGAPSCSCYVFRCQDSTKVPEIISTLRQAGKSSARTFAKRFEVLLCGRASVAHKKAPPALIDECIEKFGQLNGSGASNKGGNGGRSAAGKRPILFKRDPSFPCLQALDENGLSPEISHINTTDAHAHSAAVQPTSLQENRTMLFMVGRSQIFLVSPDTKKVAIEKSFKEISFCSQGIRHVDHFGFICRETVEGGSCHFVCYIFQCTDESLVDEIMLTLKQAFSVAALQQNAKTQSEQCDGCPMQHLHRLCERIEGLHPSKTKLELQRHLATLDNQEQASVFENTMVTSAPAPVDSQQSSSRQRLEQFKSRAKRSLTESLEGIWKVFCSAPLLWTPCFSPHTLFLVVLRCHNSTGDLKRLDSSLPLSPSASSQPGDAQPQGFRRRASTFSHPPTPSSAESSPKPRLVRHYSVSTDTPHQSNDVAALSSPSAACGVGESPLRGHRHSWRQQIFLRVATPQKNTDANERGDPCLEGGRLCAGQVGVGGSGDSSIRAVPEERTRRSREELRELWRKAILQQILLQRMETENQKLQATESDLQNKRLKLDYDEITPCLKEVTLVWEKMLGTPARAKVKFDTETIHAAVAQVVRRHNNGPVCLAWQFHTKYKQFWRDVSHLAFFLFSMPGRTFPTHPYFQAQLGAGQLSLYNLLKAYSLLDPEVGYCQGLSFIAGVLLLHMGEEDAFNMLKFLMYDVGLRKQYRPDMIILQIQMYQLSRLLHDYHRDLYVHLEQQEIGPSLYATPWFLTAFASHFPLGFVARVFDMLFLQGSEVIFKVALSLLGSHKPLILQHESLESIVDFIKTTLPNLGLVQMEKTINQVCQMDMSKQLQAYEVEYHVLQDELLDTPPSLNQQQRTAQLERTNQSLRQQNLDLLEELQVSHAHVCSLESRVEAVAQSEGRLREQVSALEGEKKQLASTAARLRDLLTGLGIHTTPEGRTLPQPPGRRAKTDDGEGPLVLPEGS